jgi:hypothetical protein
MHAFLKPFSSRSFRDLPGVLRSPGLTCSRSHSRGFQRSFPPEEAYDCPVLGLYMWLVLLTINQEYSGELLLYLHVTISNPTFTSNKTDPWSPSVTFSVALSWSRTWAGNRITKPNKLQALSSSQSQFQVG